MKTTTLVIIAFSAAIVAIALFFLRDPSDSERTRELERELASLRHQWAERSLSSPGVQPQPRETKTEETPFPDSSTKALEQKMEEITESVRGLQQAMQVIEQRLSTSQLARTRQEQEQVIAIMKDEVENQTLAFQAASAEVHAIAKRFGMNLDERALKDISFPTPLDRYPDFLQARKKATMAYQVSKATEHAYGNERTKLLLYPK